MRKRSLIAILLVAVTFAALRAVPADAGCGCKKPPPPVALVRPAFASPGDTVTLFPPENRPGKYTVQFGSAKETRVDAVYKRDLADGQYKWQVAVKAPQLPAGPTPVDLDGPGKDVKIPRSAF